MRSPSPLLSVLVLVYLQGVVPAREPPRLELFLQTGHTENVRSVALSADGKYLVTGADDQTAILWEAETGKQLQTFRGHTGLVVCVALSADGKSVVTGSLDKTAILWEAATGKNLRTFTGHTDGIHSVALSADGKHLVTGSNDETAILWEVANGKKLQTFRGHTSWVSAAALSPDGKHVWTTSADGTTRLWDAATGKERCRLYAFDRGKEWLVVTPDGSFDGSEVARRFVAYREPGTLKLHDDAATRKRFHRPGLLTLVWKGEK